MIQLLLILLTPFLCVDSHLIPPMASFSKEQMYRDVRIILPKPQNVVTESGSFVYAACNTKEKTFKENRCNVTVETPAFVDATFKQVCHMHLVPDNIKIEFLSDLRLHTFSDSKVLMSWLVKDINHKAKMGKIRILQVPTCKYNDFPIPSEAIINLVAYENAFDVILTNKTLCGSDICRVTYNIEGKMISGPTSFLNNVKDLANIGIVVPVVPRLPAKGFYLHIERVTNRGMYHIVHVSPDGKTTDLFKTPLSYVRLSNAYEAFGVCWATDRTNITCKQYDSKMNLKLNTFIEFFDDIDQPMVRWLQPHNLQDGGLLLITGQTTSKTGGRFESFSIIRIYSDGRREIPLQVEGLDFECTHIQRLSVNISENDQSEICFHFICDREDFDRQGIVEKLKFSTKCLPKNHVSLIKHRTSVLN